MAATIGRLLGTSARRVAVNGVKAFVAHSGASVIRAPQTLSCIAAQKASFSVSAARWAPAVTQPAPHFNGTAVLNGEFKEISLEDFKGKYLVLFFYPLDFTFVCPTEIIAFSDKAKEFHDVNCEVVGVSVDSHFTHLAWTNTPRKAQRTPGLGMYLSMTVFNRLHIHDYFSSPAHWFANDLTRVHIVHTPAFVMIDKLVTIATYFRLKSGGLGKIHIPLLADLTKQVSRDYGVLLEGPGIALRGLFIIDPNGVIRHMSVNDLPVGRSVEETLRLVKAFQFVETHGEVCPASWTPKSPTIKPSPEGSKEYFEKVN